MSVTHKKQTDDFVYRYEDRANEIDPETGLHLVPYPDEDTEVGQSLDQDKLIFYLKNVLIQLLHEKAWLVAADFTIRRTKYDRHPIVPDVAVFPIVPTPQTVPRGLRNWEMWRRNRPAPVVAFEISSYGTWDMDLDEKPQRYQILGTKEYFAFDPMNYWKDSQGRQLRGWDFTSGAIVELVADERGWLWSAELESWLGPDDGYLRLYDRNGQMRLTEAEEATQKAIAEEAARLIAEEQAAYERKARALEQKARIEAEQAKATEQKARIEAERQVEIEQKARAEAEQRVEAERAAMEALRVKLKERGIDPDSL